MGDNLALVHVKSLSTKEAEANIMRFGAQEVSLDSPLEQHTTTGVGGAEGTVIVGLCWKIVEAMQLVRDSLGHLDASVMQNAAVYRDLIPYLFFGRLGWLG